MGCRCVGHTFAPDSTTISSCNENAPLLSQPAHRPPTTLSPVPSPDLFRLTFTTQIPTSIHPNFFFASFLHLSHLIRLIFRFYLFRVCGLKLLPQHHRRQTTNLRFLLRGSILAEQLSSRSSLPSTMVLHEHLHSTRANALFPLPSCNHQQFNGTTLPVIFIRNFIVTKPTTARANLT